MTWSVSDWFTSEILLFSIQKIVYYKISISKLFSNCISFSKVHCIQVLRRFCWMGGFCRLVKLHPEESLPVACCSTPKTLVDFKCIMISSIPWYFFFISMTPWATLASFIRHSVLKMHLVNAFIKSSLVLPKSVAIRSRVVCRPCPSSGQHVTSL